VAASGSHGNQLPHRHLLAVKGDGQNAAELARPKGEFDALERVGIEKDCNLRVQGKR
jgi:hypothetical protein